MRKILTSNYVVKWLINDCSCESDDNERAQQRELRGRGEQYGAERAEMKQASDRRGDLRAEPSLALYLKLTPSTACRLLCAIQSDSDFTKAKPQTQLPTQLIGSSALSLGLIHYIMHSHLGHI